MGTYYTNVEKYLDKIDQGAWVELGVDRGEGSTQWFAHQAQQRGLEFYGVDMDADQIARAAKNLQDKTNIHLVTNKGEQFLQDFSKQHPDTKISLAYLDNFDWDYWLGQQEEAFVAGVKKNYQAKLGIEMTNINSQLTHLLQACYLVPLLTANSVVICDDTWVMPQEGIFSGKCSAAIPYLMLHGFKIVHGQGHRQNSGAILGRFQE